MMIPLNDAKRRFEDERAEELLARMTGRPARVSQGYMNAGWNATGASDLAVKAIGAYLRQLSAEERAVALAALLEGTDG